MKMTWGYLVSFKVLSSNMFLDEWDEIIHSAVKKYALSKGMDFYSIKLSDFSDKNQIRNFKGYDALIVGTEPFNGRIINELCGQLKFVIRFGSGYDNVDLQTAKECGIVVANTPGTNGLSVAEHTLGMMLSIYHNIHKADAKVKIGEWNDQMVGRELTGKTVGLIGFGLISQNVARLLQPFKVNLLGYSPSFDDRNVGEVRKLGVRKASIEEIFRSSDIVSLHLVLNQETENLVNKRLLSLMKDNAVIINTARGGVFNQEDLIELLQSQDKRLRVGLDVFDKEPIDEFSPLLKTEDTCLTPHISAGTYESAMRTYECAIDTIAKIRNGENLANILNG